MISLNKVELIGNLGANPELRYSQSGTPVCNFRIATNQRFTDAQGAKREVTEWHRVVVWGKLAAVCGEYLSKGRQVMVTGSLQTRQWDDKNGVTRYTTEVKAREVQFGSRTAGQSATQTVSEEEVPTAELDPEVSEEAKAFAGNPDAPF